ncbi:MAG: CoA transferase [Deltaproteobacteria bacterium]|nr:CoA transferase [Deltaproteobacteria bacterium]
MQPLANVRILDFTTLLPGPFATMYFADWGAEVLRVEAPDREDLSRMTPPFANGTSTTHAFLNRSKKSLSVDLKDPAAIETVRELVRTFDVVIEQFRPGVMAKFGLDYASLVKVNPRLIYCSLTGYGQTGSYRDRAGHDINYAALSGLAAMTGTKANGPALHGTPVCDLAGSFHAMFGIMTALYHRERTGEGQYIDVSITDASLMLSGLWLQMGLAAGKSPGWESTALNGGSFYGYYRTKDNRHLSVGGLEPKFVMRFLELIGVKDLPLTKPDAVREVKAAIQERIETRTLAAWQEIFSKADACVEPVLTIDEMIGSSLLSERSMVVSVPCGEGQSQKQLASPLKYSTFRPIYRHIGVKLGESR